MTAIKIWLHVMDKTSRMFLKKILCPSGRACVAGTVIALCLMTACSRDNIFSREYVATVNGEKIFLDDYQKRLDEGAALYTRKGLVDESQNLKRLEEEILDTMITEKIIDQRAGELGISVSNDELENRIVEIRSEYGDNFFDLLISLNVRYEDWKETVRRDMTFRKLIAADVSAGIRVSEDEAEDYYNDARDRYRTEASVHLAQIVVRDAELAEEIKTRLDAGQDFGLLAAELSIGPEATQGGDLGFITRGIMPEPLDDTIFSLSQGRISDVVQTTYGYHIVRILEIQPAKNRTFAEAKNEVTAEIRAKKEEAAYMLWLEGLKMKAVIKKEPTVLREKVKR